MIGIVLVAITILIVYMVQNKINEKKYKNFYKTPRPFKIPVVGHIHHFIGKNLLKVVQSFNYLGENFICNVPHTTYVTAIPEDLKIIFNHPNCLDKGTEYNHLQMIAGKSILLVKTKEWRVQRKMTSKSFKQVILDTFTETFDEKSCKLVELIEEGLHHKLDICYLFQKLTLDIFCEASLGVKSTILEDEEEHVFVTGVTQVQNIAFTRIANILKTSDFIFSLFDDYKKLWHHINSCNDFVGKILDEKRKMEAYNNDAMKNINRLPLLELLLQNAEKEKLTDEYIKEELFLFGSAATDTTAYTLAYTCFLLAINPDIQDKVYQEIMSICGNEKIGNEHISKMKYTEMAITESQRLLPVIPMLGRIATADIDLGHSIIPKGTNIISNHIAMQRNPKYYPDPFKYDPLRFSPEEIAKRPQITFLGFSGGPRNCLGLKYAQMLMKTTMANLLRKFEITTSHKSIHDLDFESSVVMVSRVPLDLHFTPRNKI